MCWSSKQELCIPPESTATSAEIIRSAFQSIAEVAVDSGGMHNSCFDDQHIRHLEYVRMDIGWLGVVDDDHAVADERRSDESLGSVGGGDDEITVGNICNCVGKRHGNIRIKFLDFFLQ